MNLAQLRFRVSLGRVAICYHRVPATCKQQIWWDRPHVSLVQDTRLSSVIRDVRCLACLELRSAESPFAVTASLTPASNRPGRTVATITRMSEQQYSSKNIDLPVGLGGCPVSSFGLKRNTRLLLILAE
jgi:hypothetical protein